MDLGIPGRPRSPSSFFLRRYNRRRYIPGIRIAHRERARARCTHRSVECTLLVDIYRNNSARVRASIRVQMRRASVRYRRRNVNHREITDDCVTATITFLTMRARATLSPDTLRPSSQVNRSMRRISRHDVLGRSPVFASRYCDRLGLLKSNRFLRHVYVLSVYTDFVPSKSVSFSLEKRDILSHLRRKRRSCRGC